MRDTEKERGRRDGETEGRDGERHTKNNTILFACVSNILPRDRARIIAFKSAARFELAGSLLTGAGLGITAGKRDTGRTPAKELAAYEGERAVIKWESECASAD